MILLKDVFLNKNPNTLKEYFADGILDKDGEPTINFTSNRQRPYVLLKLEEIDDDGKVINQGYGKWLGYFRKKEIVFNIKPCDLKLAIENGPKPLEWIFTIYLGIGRHNKEELLNSKVEDLYSYVKEYNREIEHPGQFVTRRVEQYFDEEGYHQTEYTCFVFWPGDINTGLYEEEIKKEFRNFGKTLME